MKRSKLTTLVIGGVAALVVLALFIGGSAREQQDEYLVRAIFDNAASLVEQSDVRVAGANVGYIKKLEVAPGDKAALTLAITDPAFQTFYEDAECEIRLQSLIGEKFIDCRAGTPSKGELPAYEGDANVRYLPLEQTTSPVDLDLNFNVLRYPARERLRLIFNEFGAALAGRGQDISEIIKKSNPSLYEIDRFLAILADNNKLLAKLAKDGDTSLVALARERKHITGLLRNATTVQDAVNERQAELRATLNKLPAFFDELEPTARELEQFAVASQPISKALNQSAGDLSTFISNLNGLATDANRGLTRFSNATEQLRSEFDVLTPLATDLRQFASYKNAAVNGRKLLESFDDQGGYANLMTLTIGIVGAMNGYDLYGHWVRSALIYTQCTSWSYQRNQECAADFTDKSVRPGAIPEPATSATKSGEAAALDYLMGSEG